MRGKQFAHAFFIEMNRLLSRTGSPCVHKGDWEYFPNKQNRGYHGALLTSSTGPDSIVSCKLRKSLFRLPKWWYDETDLKV